MLADPDTVPACYEEQDRLIISVVMSVIIFHEDWLTSCLIKVFVLLFMVGVLGRTHSGRHPGCWSL